MITSIEDYKSKWGSRTLTLLVNEILSRSPEFVGKDSLTKAVYEVLNDLEQALRHPSDMANLPASRDTVRPIR